MPGKHFFFSLRAFFSSAFLARLNIVFWWYNEKRKDDEDKRKINNKSHVRCRIISSSCYFFLLLFIERVEIFCCCFLFILVHSFLQHIQEKEMLSDMNAWSRRLTHGLVLFPSTMIISLNKGNIFFLSSQFHFYCFLLIFSVGTKRRTTNEHCGTAALDDNRTKLDFTHKNCTKINHFALDKYQPDPRDSSYESNNVIPCKYLNKTSSFSLSPKKRQIFVISQSVLETWNQEGRQRESLTRTRQDDSECITRLWLFIKKNFLLCYI